MLPQNSEHYRWRWETSTEESDKKRGRPTNGKCSKIREIEIHKKIIAHVTVILRPLITHFRGKKAGGLVLRTRIWSQQEKFAEMPTPQFIGENEQNIEKKRGFLNTHKV